MAKNPAAKVTLDLGAVSRILSRSVAELTGNSGPWNCEYNVEKESGELKNVVVTVLPL